MAKAYRYSRETGKMEPFTYRRPKGSKLSKIGQLRRKYPEGIFEIIDMDAIMQ